MSKIPAINEIDANSPSQESTEVVVKATTVTPDINEIQETISASATIQEIDGTRKPTISEIYKIVNDGLFESTTNWWDYAYKLSQAQINQDIISRLDNGVIGGGYSKGVDIITTTSNKVPSNTNVYSALKSDALYPKKLNDEVINGIYDFLNGITIGKPTAYTGGTWSVDQMGKTHLTTDYLYVRLKAIFETLQILNVNTIGGKLVISPAGSIRIAYVDRIKIDAPVFNHDETTDVWSISQIEDAEGNLINETLNQEVYRCYFLGEQDGEEIDNKWKVGDQAQAKTFNVKKGTYHKVENSYLWRLVVNVSSDTVDIDGKKYHYVDLSQIDFDSGSDAPAPGDILNQLGHRLNDTQRQTALVLNAVDNYAPSITLYAGINYYTLLNKEYVEFGVYNGKAFFNVYGDMYIGDKGTNPKTYIKYKNGKINIKANLEIGSSIGDKDLDQYIKENGGVDEETVNNLINNSQVIKDLQKQTDGAIETWFYEGEPTLDNLPAVDWNTNEIKKVHIGDLYYDQTTGYAYRFTKYNDDVNPYRWNRIKDNDIVAALEAANHAQATADGKMKVFYGDTKPTNYRVGDMWVNATLEGKFNNDIARAVTTSEVFNADDWVLASRYSEAIATIQKWTNEYETKFGNLVDEVKQQKDQSIVVWYYGYEPTVDNIPANTWNTDDLRSEHIGDIFYDIENNHSYRWTGTSWVQIKDADFDKAMKAAKDADDKAGAAGDLADSKRRIFYSATTPTEPFDKGDLWVKQVGDKTETWVYNGTDWVKSDDKDLADFSNTINDELSGIKGQLDGKAETWYQVDDPSTNWTDKASHEGDIWYNTNDGTTNYWNGSAWEQMDIPKDVFNTIDGKSSIFVDSYADAKAGTGVINKGYKERDLWILPEDATVNGVNYYKGDMLTAISNNTNFDETNWKKKVRYVGPTELNNAIDVVNDKINTINNTTIPGINKNFNDFVKDGVLNTSEKARLTDLLNQANNEVAAVVDQVNNIIKSKYLTNDNANKGNLEKANTVMNTAWTEYKNLINTLINANTEITKVNIGEANTRYNTLQEKIKAVKQYLAICQADILSGMGTDITSYKYLKDALNQTTEINGGLILTSAIQLKDVDKKVTAGMNGIVKGDKTSIAAWYGGPMVDRDTFTSEELETKVPGTDYAMSLLRHDGTGYLAGGNIHWDAGGVLSGNFNSFILQGTSMVTMFYYIRLFYLHYANQNATDFNNIDYVTPMKTFSRLSVLPLGGIEGGNNLPTGLFIGDSNTGGSFQIGNIILRTKSGDPNILEIVSASNNKTAHLGVQGGVSAYGTYTPSTGGGGGLSGTIVPYSTAITFDPQNEGSKIASASSIYKLHSRISAIETNGATNISVTGSGNAITSVSKNGNSIAFTKGATFLTSHQSLAGYATQSWVNDKGYATQSWVNDKGYITANDNITGNAATATKLKSTVKIFGNDFDGTNNISEYIKVNENFIIGIGNEIYNSKDTLLINYSLRGGQNVSICNGAGNVAIGGNNYEHKLTVAGDTSVSGTLYANKLVGYLDYSYITNHPSSFPASDVYAWAKKSTKPSYSWNEINNRPTVVSAFTNDAKYLSKTLPIVNDANAAVGDIGFSVFEARGNVVNSNKYIDGFITSFNWGANYCSQVFIDSDPTYGMMIRHRGANAQWNSWKEIITENNIMNQHVNASDNTYNVIGERFNLDLNSKGISILKFINVNPDTYIHFKVIRVGAYDITYRESEVSVSFTNRNINEVYINCVGNALTRCRIFLYNNEFYLAIEGDTLNHGYSSLIVIGSNISFSNLFTTTSLKLIPDNVTFGKYSVLNTLSKGNGMIYYDGNILSTGNITASSITITGTATFNGTSNFNGATTINSLLTAKGIMPTTPNVNAFGTNVNNWDGSIGANVTNMFNGIEHNNISLEYSVNGGTSWTTYSTNPNYLFNLINDNSDTKNFYLGNNEISGSSDANKLTQIKKNQLRVTIKIPPEIYQELSWISVDVNNGVSIKCQVYFGNSSGVYTEYVSKVITGWSHRCDICVGPLNVNVGNDKYRYVRLVFSHLSNHTGLRNGIVSRIRALALTKYNNPSERYNISTTGHIYNYDYNMNTYFPNSILAKGGVTAYQSSDIRLKTNITKLNCLNVIKSIGGTYEFDYIRDHKHSIGFIAQNVNNPLLKDIVAKDDNGYLKINYWNPKLISLAFGALTEIDDEVDKLKARVRELENEVEQLKK